MQAFFGTELDVVLVAVSIPKYCIKTDAYGLTGEGITRRRHACYVRDASVLRTDERYKREARATPK